MKRIEWEMLEAAGAPQHSRPRGISYNRREVMNPPSSAALGLEAGNLSTCGNALGIGTVQAKAEGLQRAGRALQRSPQ
jgi:hypothetical protein